jgi:hypothetical protein
MIAPAPAPAGHAPTRSRPGALRPKGQTLAELVRAHGPLTLIQAIAVVDQVLQALEALVAAGVVRRDLSSRNLVLTRSGLIRLIDVGDRTGLSLVDPADVRADLYAVAVLLYELLTGAAPFDDDASPPELPREVDAVLLQTLAGTPAEMRAALRQLVRRQTVVEPATAPAPVEASAQPAARPRPRWRRTLARGLAAAVVLLAIAITEIVFVAASRPAEPAISADSARMTAVEATASATATATATPSPTATAPAPLRAAQAQVTPTTIATRRAVPTVSPTPERRAVDDSWPATLARVDAAWAIGDWPTVIDLLDAFLTRSPTHEVAAEKLYAALVAEGVRLVGADRAREAAVYFVQAQAVQPERGEAPAALRALTPTPEAQPVHSSPAPAAPAVVARSAQAVAPAPPAPPRVVAPVAHSAATATPVPDTPTPTVTPPAATPTVTPTAVWTATPTATPTRGLPTMTPTRVPAKVPPTLTPTAIVPATATPTATRVPATVTPSVIATVTRTPPPAPTSTGTPTPRAATPSAVPATPTNVPAKPSQAQPTAPAKPAQAQPTAPAKPALAAPTAAAPAATRTR